MTYPKAYDCVDDDGEVRNTFVLTVKKDRPTGEWVARVTLNGRLLSDYWAGDDRTDAMMTGEKMLAHYQNGDK